MGDWHFIVCLACKEAEWIDDEDIIEYIADHEGHLFRIMVPEVFEDRAKFRTWFLSMMSWPEEVKE